MFDPERLLGDTIDIGITCALIPRNTPGVEHRPAPLSAQRPVPERTHPGQGCVRAARLHHRRRGDGRQRLAHAGGAALSRALHLAALQRHRRRQGGGVGDAAPTRASARQFNLPVGRFEGVETVIARMVGLTYTMDAARSVTAGAIDGGEKPSVPFGDAQVPRHRDGAAGRQRRHGRARRQGHLPGSAQLSRPRLPDRAGGDHGGGRQPPHAQSHHLRPGRGALPSVRAARDDRGAQPRPRRRRR